MEEVKKEKKRINGLRLTFHVISAVAVLISLCFSIFYFRNVAHRSGQAFVDLKNSTVHLLQFFQWLFFDTEIVTLPTVNQIPADMDNILPMSWEEVKTFIAGYAKTVFSTETFSAYFLAISDVLFWGSFFIVPVLAIVGLIALILYLIYSSVDNDYGKETKSKIAWLKVEYKFFLPIIRFCKFYVEFLKNNGKAYRFILGLIWAYNLNVVTIVVEAVALYLYLLPTSDYANLFVQIAKLGMDLTVALDFVPLGIWMLVAWKIFDKWRREKGFEKLEANEEKNEKFLIEHPENILATGEPRVGKTQAITDMTKSQESIFRKKAKEQSFQRRMQFPFFHWGILEKTIRNLRANVPTFSLAYLREFLYTAENAYKGRALIAKETQAIIWGRLKRVGYAGRGTNFLFDYDVDRFGTKYNNKLKIVDIFESIRLYAEEYYIYTNPTPLSFSNYPIKFDFDWKDFGNYPLLNIDYFRKDPAEIEKKKQFSHLLIYDTMRPGVQKNPNGPYNNNNELGSVTIGEIGKERGNQRTNQGTKKDDEKCNTANDLFEMDAKMRSHGTTIDYFTYFRIFSDEQRAMELLASLREIGSEVKICNKKTPKILMPGFAWEELIYQASTALTVKITDFITSRKGSEGLFFHLVMRAYSPIFNHYWRTYNVYSSYDVDLKIMNQAQGQTLAESAKYKYHISTKKVRSNVYDTGYFGVYYRERAKKSKTGGINQVPQWSDVVPSIAQMKQLGSHNFDAMFEQMKIA